MYDTMVLRHWTLAADTVTPETWETIEVFLVIAPACCLMRISRFCAETGNPGVESGRFRKVERDESK